MGTAGQSIVHARKVDEAVPVEGMALISMVACTQPRRLVTKEDGVEGARRCQQVIRFADVS